MSGMTSGGRLPVRGARGAAARGEGAVTQRRWQRGETALCSCGGAESLAVPVVAGAYPGHPPSVERDGAVHACATATPLRDPGRPRTSGALPRIDVALAARVRRAAAADEIGEIEWLELAILDRLEKTGG